MYLATYVCSPYARNLGMLVMYHVQLPVQSLRRGSTCGYREVRQNRIVQRADCAKFKYTPTEFRSGCEQAQFPSIA